MVEVVSRHLAVAAYLVLKPIPHPPCLALVVVEACLDLPTNRELVALEPSETVAGKKLVALDSILETFLKNL